MGDVVSAALQVVPDIIEVVAEPFKRRPNRPLPIDNGIMAEMQRIRNEQQQCQGQLNACANQLQEQAKINQAQAQSLANRKQEMLLEQNRIQIEMQRKADEIAQQNREAMRRDHENQLAQAKIDAQRDELHREQQQKNQEAMRRDQENKLAQAKIDAQRDELHREQQQYRGQLNALANQLQEQAKINQEQANIHKAQSQELANRKQEMLLEQNRIQIEMQRKADEIAQQNQEVMRRDQENKFAQAKIDAQRDERHRERDPKKLLWLRQQAKKTLGLDYVNAYNICVTGRSGTGKSTTINGVCGFDEKDFNNAAKVGVNECTGEIKKYTHPTIKHLFIWDCPGAGTESHPKETYFYDKFLFGFDYLLFVCTTRIDQIDIDLMKQAIAHKVPFALVRNKANQDLAAKRRIPEFELLPQSEMVPSLIEEHHDFMRNELQKAGIAASDMPLFFVINAWAFTDERQVCFEEVQLIEYVLKTVPERRN